MNSGDAHVLDAINRKSDETIRKVDRLLRLVEVGFGIVIREEVANMKIGDQILGAITEETTAVDGLLVFVKEQVDNNTITPAQGAEIIGAINAERDKVNAALLANVPPAPAPPVAEPPAPESPPAG